jgi:hypothetical protein
MHFNVDSICFIHIKPHPPQMHEQVWYTDHRLIPVVSTTIKQVNINVLNITTLHTVLAICMTLLVSKH